MEILKELLYYVINTLEHQKGYHYIYYRFAYIEFSSVEAKEKAKQMNDSLFKGRQIKVNNL